MFKILESKENRIALQVEGKINKNDYEELNKILQEKARNFGVINMYMELKNIEGVTPKAALDDIMTNFKYIAKFNKIAVIGEDNWGSLLASTSSEFYSANIRYFPFHRIQEATTWLD